MSDTEVEDRSVEPLDWDEDFKKSIEGVPPNAKYGAASESIRHSIPEARVCAMFCKGKNCKYDTVHNWKKEQMEIEGLYSNWITKNIVAIARPNTQNIEKYDIIGQFKRHGIKSIINLQQPGEHSTCGPPLEPGGFSYSQTDFMDKDIFFYNFGWQDYGVGSLSNILDMVKVMQFALSEGKVAVHCHAGLGRTGVLIASYLVYANRMNPWEVVHYIRSKRPPSIQTRSQLICIEEFAQYLVPLRVVFCTPKVKTYHFTLSQFLTRQKHMLHGLEARSLKFIPKIIHESCERLLKLSGHGQKHHDQQDNLKDILRNAPSALNNRTPSPQKSFTHSQSEPGGMPKTKSVSVESFTALGQTLRSSASDTDRSSTPEPDRRRKNKHGLVSNRVSSGSLASHASVDSRASLSSGLGSLNGSTKEEQVAVAMAQTEYDEATKAAIEELKDAINDGHGGWKKLQKTKDPVVVAGIMWDWLDNLKEPILHAQDLPHMLEYTGSPREGLKLLSKGAEQTVLFLFRCIVRLGTLSDEIERSVVQRSLSTLTHQNMVVEMDSILSNKSIVRRTSNNSGLMRSSVASKMMYFFMHLLALLQDEQETKLRESQMAARLSEEEPQRSRRGKAPKPERNGLGSSVARRKSLEAEDLGMFSQKKSPMLDRKKLAEYREEDEEEEEDDMVIVKTSPKKKRPLGKRLPPIKT